MVLRKPYAFLIKHFKMIHLFLTGAILYLIVRMSHVIGFVNEYLDANIKLITLSQFRTVYNIFDFIIPVLILGFSIILFLIMTVKKKPNRFYLYSTIISVLLLILNIYGYITLRSLTEVWLQANRLSVMNDMYLFMMISFVVLCGMSLSRGLGFNIGRFDFNNDIADIDVSEEDNAEFEVSIDFDINDVKRDAKKQIRYMKYFYKENKTAILTVVGVFACFILIYSLGTFLRYRKDVTKGNLLSANGFDITVNNSYIIDTDAQGNDLADNTHLLVVDVDVKNVGYLEGETLNTGLISLDIGSNTYHTTREYDTSAVDLGKVYNDELVKYDTSMRRLLIFKVPTNRLFSRILFGIRDNGGNTVYLKLNPKDLSDKKNKIVEVFLGDELKLEESAIDNVNIKINKVETGDRFKLNYNYCINKTRCVNSIEYLTPISALSNYDKTLLKLEGTFEVKDNLLFKDFFSLFESFGYIEYKINGKTYRQTSGFKEAKSTKIKNLKAIYIETYNDLASADDICLGLKIRNTEYRYYLSGGAN